MQSSGARSARGLLGCLTAELASPSGGNPADRSAARREDYHSKKTSRSKGQNRRITLPMMLPTGTEPNVRESEDDCRLSPSTKIAPSGTVNGNLIVAACGVVGCPRVAAYSMSFPLT